MENATSAQPEVSIIIPCLNEVRTIAATVLKARDALDRFGYVGEVIVCDNSSDDGSAADAERAGARVVHQPIRGYGAACLRGVEVAQAPLLVFTDADGTYDLSVLNRFVEPLRAGYDLVVGTRRNGAIQPGSMRRRHRHVLEPVQTALFRRSFDLRISDVRCGLRGIRREAMERLGLGSTGMEFATEMLSRAAKLGLETVEVPVTFRPRPAEQSRRSVGDSWRVARQLLLMSPTRLFVLPGIALSVLGLALELALLPGPIRILSLTLDFHFMFVGGAMALLGIQLVLLGLYAKTWLLVNEPALADRWVRWFHLRYTLERGMAIGGTLFGAGLVINAWILSDWLSAGAGVLFAVRPAMLALTLMVAGAEIAFAAIFLSVLRGPHFSRV